MPNETSQPLGEQPTRSDKDTELVGQVLGSEAARDMEELTGKDDTDTSSSTTASDLEISDAEFGATQQAERDVTPEQRKQEYIKWAEDIGSNKQWVNNYFHFNDDSTVEYLFRFTHNIYPKIKGFPESLKKFRRSVYLKGCGWDKNSFNSLKGKTIEGDLVIDVRDTKKIPSEINCKSILILMSSSEKKANPGNTELESGIMSELKVLGYENIHFLY